MYYIAVYYNNIFFVLFGIDGNGYQTNDIHFMDTKRITWLPTFSPDSTLNQSDKKPLIIGASVGSFIAVMHIYTHSVLIYITYAVLS